MFPIKKCSVPANTMLDKYSANEAYADCYFTEVPGQVSFPEFIFAFYTTALFKLERLILKLAISKPSTDIEASELADGSSSKFAAWHVEDRSENELLMCDFRERTRSWLMVVPLNAAGDARTRLYFGSAVVPVRNSKTGKLSVGFTYEALLGFHRIYLILLLYSAKSNIKRQLSE
jgi:hypothetical protein